MLGLVDLLFIWLLFHYSLSVTVLFGRSLQQIGMFFNFFFFSFPCWQVFGIFSMLCGKKKSLDILLTFNLISWHIRHNASETTWVTKFCHHSFLETWYSESTFFSFTEFFHTYFSAFTTANVTCHLSEQLQAFIPLKM